jgi:hypothetical protein
MSSKTLTAIVDAQHLLALPISFAPYRVSIREPARPSRSITRRRLSLRRRQQILDCELAYEPVYALEDLRDLSPEHRERYLRRLDGFIDAPSDVSTFAAILDVMRCCLYDEPRHSEPLTAEIIEDDVLRHGVVPKPKWYLRRVGYAGVDWVLRLSLKSCSPSPDMVSIADSLLRYAIDFPSGSVATLSYRLRLQNSIR